MMENTIDLPHDIQFVTTQEIIDLRVAQHQARVDLRLNPFAWAMNVKLRLYFHGRQGLKVARRRIAFDRQCREAE